MDFSKEDLMPDEAQIIFDYLSNGDNQKLKEKIAEKIGLEYKDPLLNVDLSVNPEETEQEEAGIKGQKGASQVLKEIRKNEKLN